MTHRNILKFQFACVNDIRIVWELGGVSSDYGPLSHEDLYHIKNVLTDGIHIDFFFFNDPAPTEIYPLPLHDPLRISRQQPAGLVLDQQMVDSVAAEAPVSNGLAADHPRANGVGSVWLNVFHLRELDPVFVAKRQVPEIRRAHV